MAAETQTYSLAARRFHWWTAALLAVQIPAGIAMTVRGGWLNIWDTVTNTLYSGHKLLGAVIFLVVAGRLIYRAVHGAPADEPTLTAWERLVSHTTHWAIYALLLAVPLLGWWGVQLYPALDIFGLFSLPAVVGPDQARSAAVLGLHRVAAFALLGLVALHAGAALFHFLIRRDRVLARMLPLAGHLKRL